MSKNILIVDYTAFMREALKNMITKAAYNVVTQASGGKDVIEKNIYLNPELVTIDITMPNIDGIEAV